MQRWVLIGVTGILLLAVFARRVIQQRGTPSGSRGTTSSSTVRQGRSNAATSSDPVKRGEAVYYRQCSVCHSADTVEIIIGPSMKGYFENAPTKLSNGKLFPRTDAAIRDLLVVGTRDMPPMIQDLAEPEIADLLAFLHTL